MAYRPNDPNPPAKRRLRIPAALAVAVVGTSATVALTFSGCNTSPTPDPIDAKPSHNIHGDAGNDDGGVDGAVAPDAPDAVVDASIDSAPDAFVYQDAAPPKPIDARPDTPVA